MTKKLLPFKEAVQREVNVLRGLADFHNIYGIQPFRAPLHVERHCVVFTNKVSETR